MYFLATLTPLLSPTPTTAIGPATTEEMKTPSDQGGADVDEPGPSFSAPEPYEFSSELPTRPRQSRITETEEDLQKARLIKKWILL